MLSHVSYANLSGGQMEFFAPFGSQAVDVFFVLSGFVIAHVCVTKEKDASSYFVSRAARIYSVAIPTLILVPIVDAIGVRLDAATYQGSYQQIVPGLVIRSVLFIGEMWNAHRFPGTDGPYWSLGFEVWYYVIFGLFIFMKGNWRWLAPAAALVFIGPKVAIMFPAWLVGVTAYQLCTKNKLSENIGWLLFILSFVLFVTYQLLPHSPLEAFRNLSFSSERLQVVAQDYFLAVVFGMNVVGFSAISQRFSGLLSRCSKTIRWIAGGTFSLYLMHLPVLYLLSALSPWAKQSSWTLALLLILTPIICMLFAEISERRKNEWRRLFAYLSNQVVPQPQGAPVETIESPRKVPHLRRHSSAE